jgi:hypothetical protein
MMMMPVSCIIFTVTSNNKAVTLIGFYAVSVCAQAQRIMHGLFFILLLDFKLMLPKYCNNNTRLVGLQVCVIGK